MSELFIGYPSRPEVSREALADAATKLDKVGGVNAGTWEALRIAGRVIIKRVLAAIDSADVAMFDVTGLNENVMFEVGYATGRDRRLWLLRDATNAPAHDRIRQMGLLAGVGHISYESSEDILARFLEQRPDQATSETLLSDLLGSAEVTGPASLFYFKSPYNTDPERAITRNVDAQRTRGVRCVVADARESSVEPLSWYTSHCVNAAAVVIHLSAPHQPGAEIHNARGALIGGLALGLGKPVLMLAHESYRTPLDYEDLLYSYTSARDVSDRLAPWLNRNLHEAQAEVEDREQEAAKRRRSTELGRIHLGEPVAENEVDALADYFIETSFYEDVLEPSTGIFVGRKGSGKTATLYRAAAELEADRRNLVCVIQPSSYDLDGLLRLLQRFQQPDSKSFLVETLWKYLLYSEIALAAQRDLLSRPAGLNPESPEWEFNSYLHGPGQVFSLDFAVRLERTVESLLRAPGGKGIEDERARISQALHAEILTELKAKLSAALRGKARVAVLIDNLDQAWSTASDYRDLSFLLLGLLNTVRGLGMDFAKVPGSAGTKLTLAVFLRSDIFYRVAVSAREPDKLPIHRITWTDAPQLLRVVESRYIASRGENTPPDELWRRWFPPTVRRAAMPGYMTSRVLPRPRDILHLCRGALDVAQRRGHPTIDEADMLEAERQYSQFAFEALQVEMGSLPGGLEDIFYEFAGLSEVLSESEISQALDAGGVKPEERKDVLDQLRLLSFVGVEIAEGDFRFAEDPAELRMTDALAEQLRRTTGEGRRYRVHPAFQAYLEIASHHDVQEQLEMGEG